MASPPILPAAGSISCSQDRRLSGEFLPHVFDDSFTRRTSTVSADDFVPLANFEEEGRVGVASGTEWWQSLLVILASVLGVGVLSLPEALATLGWIAGTIVMAASAMVAWWSGRMYGRLVLAVPDATVLADVSEKAYGRSGRILTMWLGYTYIAGTAVVYHLTATEALQQALQDLPYFECQPVAGLIFGLVMLLPLQAQSMHAVSAVSILGSATIFVALGIVIAQLVAAGPAPGARTVLMEPFSPQHWAAGTTCYIYAFAGQAIFVELISKQRDIASFKHAVDISAGVAVVFYCVCASLGYLYVGRDISGPLTSVLPAGPPARIVNTCLFIHVAIGYLIEVNVLSDALLRLLGAGASVASGTDGSPTKKEGAELAPFGQIPWLAASASIVAFSYILESSIPFFSELVSLSGALTATQIMMTIPSLCALRLLPGMRRCERLQCYLVLPVSVALSLLGASGALIDIANALADKNRPRPWACAVSGGGTSVN